MKRGESKGEPELHHEAIQYSQWLRLLRASQRSCERGTRRGAEENEQDVSRGLTAWKDLKHARINPITLTHKDRTEGVNEVRILLGG
jgi:hypothetical protein